MKPGYPKHRKTRAVGRDARLLNIHLWNLADDEGRLQELPQWIIGEIFPTDEDVTPGVLREWLVELHTAGLIERYEVDGEQYIQCHDFNDHQVINRPSPSQIPPSDAGNAVSMNSHGAVPEPPHENSTPEVEQGKGSGTGKGKSPAVAADAPLSELLADLVAANDPNGKRPTVRAAWREAEDRMLRLDRRNVDEAERLIRWTQNDDFWRANVQSMPKFREKYGQLYLAAVEDARKRGRRTSPGMANAHRLAEKARELEAEEAAL